MNYNICEIYRKKDNAKLLHLLHTVGNQRVESNFHLFNTENVKWTGEFSSSLWPLLYTVQVGDPYYPVHFFFNLHISSKSAQKTTYNCLWKGNPCLFKYVPYKAELTTGEVLLLHFQNFTVCNLEIRYFLCSVCS